EPRLGVEHLPGVRDIPTGRAPRRSAQVGEVLPQQRVSVELALEPGQVRLRLRRRAGKGCSELYMPVSGGPQRERLEQPARLAALAGSDERMTLFAGTGAAQPAAAVPAEREVEVGEGDPPLVFDQVPEVEQGEQQRVETGYGSSSFCGLKEARIHGG